MIDVSAARRSTGRLIAMVLLAVLVIGAAWYVVSHVRSAAPTVTASPKP
jgi:hypothetical protein